MTSIDGKDVLRVLRESRSASLTPTGILKRMGLTKKHRGALRRILEELEEKGEIVRVRKNRFAIPEKWSLLSGKIQRFREGFGFLLVKDGPDVFIPPHRMKGALTGDRVMVRLSSRSKAGRPEGEVLRILRRGKTTFVGTFLGTHRLGVVTPDDPGMPSQIPVPKGRTMGARNRDKVVFTSTERRGHLSANIAEVIGSGDDPSTDLKVVIRQFDLPEAFPEEVLERASMVKRILKRRDLSTREDLRELFIFTIDPRDAKDFDDAISISKTPSGFSLGVYIADVSHYVREGDPLDEEAWRRGTSIYLLDKVIPMLPHRISNEICSLKPYEDRLALTVWMTFDRNGNLLKRRFGRTIIRSKARLTYEDASSILDGRPPLSGSVSIFRKEDFEKIRGALLISRELSRKLRHLRWMRGSLDFDLPEPEITLLPTGAVSEIRPLQRLETHQIIEDFMIRANETVAEYLLQKEVPTIFRVHEPPSPLKIRGFLELVQSLLGKVFSVSSPKDLQEIIELSKGRPEEPLLNYLLLRSLTRAEYSTENIGHFGLASKAYLHFTSPIRRYPDLVVHRIVKGVLSRRPKVGEKWEEYLEKTAERSSEMERRAESAEFALVDLKKLEFMKAKLGEEYEGIITHVAASGFFVEIPENLAEGFVSLDSLNGYFRFSQTQRALVARGGRSFRIGQRVRVKVTRVDKALRKLDFVVVEP